MNIKGKSRHAPRHKPEHAKAPYCLDEHAEVTKPSRINRHIKRTWKRGQK